ncbi:MAG: sigma-54 dependent transcriptional regulator [Bacteroidales bacterium]|nr:sigma-54-dependent Fis family transcriptional regulator [Bacteroidales bacterium]MCI5481959.1 sigma-54 dependent transcriptional regulator [Bacteroidales bacterium]MDD6750878.1 sigma-54 dependent transcriptional regulator [Bacteroidales bacterium]MDY2878302.1 sigma-54 dependent transcriptional regulator [Candidatus Cryptobacteroides sp.]
MDTQELQILKNRFGVIGNDLQLNHAIEVAMAVAPTDLSVLVCGESGVGKEVLPKIIHQYSRRRNGRFLAINCGAIPPGTINAELFGHEKGSFTGAVSERKGYFEEADGGTLVLDEIGELPKETQAMLLRVLQDGEFLKVGSSKVEKTDVRIIASTNVNLEHAVATGKFRADLYYRLSGVRIDLPSLRERSKEDICLLFRKFSSDFADKFRLCKFSLTHDAVGLLTSYRWPGNIRQLKNVAEAATGILSKPASTITERIEVDAAMLSPFIPAEKDELLPALAAPSGGGQALGSEDKQMIIKAIFDLKNEFVRLKHEVDLLKSGVREEQGVAKALPVVHSGPLHIEEEEPEEQGGEPAASVPAEDVEVQANTNLKNVSDILIKQALERHGGKVSSAAKELGISERTIYRKIKQWKEQ